MRRRRAAASAAPARLSAAQLREHLILEEPAIARLVRRLRDTVLTTLPTAAEGIKFGVLCYYHADAFFKSIGGNICMIEVKGGPRESRRVVLSFIRGAAIPDPAGLLQGRAKLKRFLPIPEASWAKRADVLALLRAAGSLPLED